MYSNSATDSDEREFTHGIYTYNADAVNKVLASKNGAECYKLFTEKSMRNQNLLHFMLEDIRTAHCKKTHANRMKTLVAILSKVPNEKKLEYLALPNTEGRTALHIAAINGEKSIVDYLLINISFLDRCKLINKCDDQMLTVVQHSIRRDIKKLILESIDPPNIEGNLTEYAPTHLSKDLVFLNHSHVIDDAQTSKSYELAFDLRNAEGQTLLHLAAQHKRHDVVMKLLSAVEDKTQHWELISKECKNGKTALHYACAADSVEITTTLLKYSRERDVGLTKLLDNKSYTASRYAKSREITKLLSLVESHYWRVFYQRPKAVIFYNRFSSKQRWRRDGAEEEKNYMRQALEQYGIVPQVHVDFSENTFKSKLTDFIEGEADISALIVIIMSHGELGYIYDINLRLVRIQTLIDTMCYNSKLENVPKVLVLQCCQGAGDSTNPANDCRHNRSDAATISPLLTRKAPADPATYQIPAGDNSTTIICSALGGQTSIRGRMAEAFSGTATQSSRPGDVIDIFRSISRQMGRRLSPVLLTTMSRTLTLTNLLTQRTLLERIRDLFL